jgi:predicted dehydrogenase
MRVGFLGAGLIATYHSKMIRRSGVDVERAGVFDPDSARAASFAAASGHRVVESADAVVDDADVVYVCTWTSEHLALVRAVVERGRAVFCEKPLAPTLAGAEELAAAVIASGVVNQVGLVLRHSPAYRLARALVQDPAAGPPMAAVLRDDQFIPVQGHYGSTWRGDVRRAGSGTLLEHSIHDVDMLEYLADRVVSVSARSRAFHEIDGIEDAVTVSLGFRSGALGTLASVWHDNLARPSLRRTEIFCARRYVVIEGDDWFGPVSWTDTDGHTTTRSGDDLVAAAYAVDGLDPNPDGCFLRAVATGRPGEPDVAVALRAHRVVAAIYESAAAGGDAIECGQ